MGKKGFTLIEILAVLGIISILAALSVPRFTAVRDRALVSTMTGDLHNLRYAQELYYRNPDNDYADDLEDLGDTFTSSEEVVVTITDAGPYHFSAEATHPGTTRVCTYTTEVNLIECTEPEAGKGGGK